MERISGMIAAITCGLTPKQVSLVAFIGTFVTLIGALGLAFWFRRQNRKTQPNMDRRVAA